MKKYLHLIKYILSAAIAFSACIGFSLSTSSFGGLDIGNWNLFGIWDLRFGICFIGVFLLSAGASALNQYLERKTDKLMLRTSSRPIPSGQISPARALAFSLVLIFTGALLLSFLSIYAMMLGLANVILYDFVYTPLKYKTNLALLPGGLVGAIPPLIGWFAAGETSLALPIICFSVFMFLWQIPHFIILNMKYRDDYVKAGILTLTGAFDLTKVKRILFIWFVSAGLISLLFPFAGIISSPKQMIFLIILNALIIISFAYLVLNKNESRLYKGNVLIHAYLLLNFILIIAGKLF